MITAYIYALAIVLSIFPAFPRLP